MRLIRPSRPPLTASRCADCRRQVLERERRPCPGCGSTARIISRTATDTVAARDRL